MVKNRCFFLPQDWERDPDCRGWLTRLKRDKTNVVAFCKYCQQELCPKLETLKKHGRTSKHAQAAKNIEKQIKERYKKLCTIQNTE